MKIVGIIQARVNSKRLPGKVLLPLNGKPALYYIMARVSTCKHLNKIYLATSTQHENNILEEMASTYRWDIYRGSEHDVLSRFVDIVKQEKPDIVARINADNFAIDPSVISHGIESLIDKQLDVCSPFIKNTYPFGSGAEIATAKSVLRVDRDTAGAPAYYREHIFFYAYEHLNKYRVGLLKAPKHLNRPDINISVDTERDYKIMKYLYSTLEGREHIFSTADIIKVWDALELGRYQDGEHVHR